MGGARNWTGDYGPQEGFMAVPGYREAEEGEPVGHAVRGEEPGDPPQAGRAEGDVY